MRTLTQVWFIHTSIALIFLLLSFQLLGRVGILLGLGGVLIFLYAALRKNLQFLWLPQKTQLLCGNDPSGFLQLIQEKQFEYGFKKIEIYLSPKHTPPLVWKNSDEYGRIIINENLLSNLSYDEIKLFTHFILAHLQCRSFVLPQFLSSVRWSFLLLNLFSKIFSFSLNKIVQKNSEIYKADLKYLNNANCSPYDAGYFLNKLHHLHFNKSRPINHFCFFSTLSFNKAFLNEEFGLPYLHVRLQRLMGFSI
jgi:hypothetical protein